MSVAMEKLDERNVSPEHQPNIASTTDYDSAYLLQKLLIARATGSKDETENEEYIKLRSYFFHKGDYKHLLPEWVGRHRDLSQFWPFIKHKFPTYNERKTFIYDGFSKILQFLESGNIHPAENSIGNSLSKFDKEHIYKY